MQELQILATSRRRRYELVHHHVNGVQQTKQKLFICLHAIFIFHTLAHTRIRKFAENIYNRFKYNLQI